MIARVLCLNDIGFIMIRKSCTTSIKWVVREAMGLEHDVSLHTDDRLQYRPLNQLGDIKTVAIIRCPHQRLLSTWRNKMHDQKNHAGAARLRSLGLRVGCTFEGFIERAELIIEQEGHLRHQYMHLPRRVDYMLRFENIESGWLLLQCKFPALPDLPKRNATNYGRPSWRDYYTAKTEKKVSEMYSTDIALWQVLNNRKEGSLEDARWIT